ncbi:MAG: helix-turn-helix domain-containing protein [Flavobacteriaceae bacterium]|nr:MAG: helix-turn-helix domain-containing protein [Flavobacteriaceae bacterium]QMU66192.1 MAG: helix-turn-helix domain-containing protein [Flavobacteriaceae bacterium]
MKTRLFTIFVLLISIITMKDLATRLLETRKQRKLSQQQVADIAGVHFTNVGKYERAEAMPSADVLNRVAKALEVSPDFLLNGTIQDKAKNNIQDTELLLQFEKIEKLSDKKKTLVKEFIDAFILKANLQQQLS